MKDLVLFFFFPYCFAPVCLLYFYTVHFWSPNVCGFFPYQTILHNTSWVSQNFTQFWCHLPGDNVRSHSLRAQSPKTAPFPDFRWPVSSSWFPRYPQLLPDLATNQRSPWPPPQVCVICQSCSQNSGKQIYQLIKVAGASPSGWVYSPTRKPSRLHCWDFMEAFSCRHHQLLTHFWPLSSLWTIVPSF